MSYQLGRLDLVVNNATTQITVNTSPSTQSYINGDITPSDSIISVANSLKYSNPEDTPAATISVTSKAASLINLTATEIGVFSVPISEPIGGKGLKNSFTTYYDGITYSPGLLTCVGGNPTSTTISDLSSNNFTITNNGAATTSSFAPFSSSYAYSSVLFNGTSQSLTTTSTINDSLDLATGAGNWTIELWFYLNSVTGTQTLFGKGGTSGSVNPSYTLSIASGTGQWVIGNGGGGGFAQNFPAATVANTWYHFALVRNGLTITSYVNGIGGTPYTLGFTMANTGNLFAVGRSSDGSTNFVNGYISNFRIVKGLALYIGDFIPTPGNFLSVPITLSKTKIASSTTIAKYEPLNIKFYNKLSYNTSFGLNEPYETTLTINSYVDSTANKNVLSSTTTMNVASRPKFYINGSDAPNISGNQTYIKLVTKNSDPRLVSGYFNSFIPEHTGEEDQVQAWI